MELIQDVANAVRRSAQVEAFPSERIVRAAPQSDRIVLWQNGSWRTFDSYQALIADVGAVPLNPDLRLQELRLDYTRQRLQIELRRRRELLCDRIAWAVLFAVCGVAMVIGVVLP